MNDRVKFEDDEFEVVSSGFTLLVLACLKIIFVGMLLLSVSEVHSIERWCGKFLALRIEK